MSQPTIGSAASATGTAMAPRAAAKVHDLSDWTDPATERMRRPMTADGLMRQEAPYPAVLAELVSQLRYRDNWRFELCDLNRGQGSRGLTLVITARVADSYARHEDINVAHYMPVPPAAFDERSWRRWLFDQILLVERHEACEFFQIGGGRPYAPSHGPGNDPYLVREIGTSEDQRTSYLGELAEAG